jgi:hypothetical protein
MFKAAQLLHQHRLQHTDRQAVAESYKPLKGLPVKGLPVKGLPVTGATEATCRPLSCMTQMLATKVQITTALIHRVHPLCAKICVPMFVTQ